MGNKTERNQENFLACQFWAGLVKAELKYPKVSAKSESKYESLKALLV